MSKLSREDVFSLLNEEREYQDNYILKKYNYKEYSSSEWLMIIRKYISDAENGIIDEDEYKVLSSIRKATAMCILMLEEKGCIGRNKEK